MVPRVVTLLKSDRRSANNSSFPKGREYNNWTQEFLPTYIENSLAVGDANWNRLMDGIISAGIYAQINFAEKTSTSLYMAQALVSPVGDVLIHRHKLRPSGNERAMFTDGTIGEIVAVTTPYGRVGLLECGEYVILEVFEGVN